MAAIGEPLSALARRGSAALSVDGSHLVGLEDIGGRDRSQVALRVKVDRQGAQWSVYCTAGMVEESGRLAHSPFLVDVGHYLSCH